MQVDKYLFYYVLYFFDYFGVYKLKKYIIKLNLIIIMIIMIIVIMIMIIIIIIIVIVTVRYYKNTCYNKILCQYKHFKISLLIRLSLPHVQRMCVHPDCERIVQSSSNAVHGVQSEVASTRSKFSFRFVRHVLILQREIPSRQVRAKHSRSEFNTTRVSFESLWVSLNTR